MKEKKISQLIFKWLDKNLDVVCYIFGGIIVIAILFYVVRFHTYNLSTSTEHWGQFGDYLGGVLNPILAMANMIFLIYLTLSVKRRDKKANKKSIKVQKFLALTQFRQDAFNKLKEDLKKVNRFPDSFTEMEKLYKNLAFKVNEFNTYNDYLFKNEDYKWIINKFYMCCVEVEHFSKTLKNEKPLLKPLQAYLSFEPQHEGFVEAYNKFENLREDLTSVISHLIIDEPYQIKRR